MCVRGTSLSGPPAHRACLSVSGEHPLVVPLLTVPVCIRGTSLSGPPAHRACLCVCVSGEHPLVVPLLTVPVCIRGTSLSGPPAHRACLCVCVSGEHPLVVPLLTVPVCVCVCQGNIEYYSTEVELNAKFRVFAKNCAVVFAGHNTVSAQLRFKSKRGNCVSSFAC